MTPGPRIPNPVAVVVGRALGAHYYSHRQLNNLFVEKGAPGDPPLENCEDKSIEWLKRASAGATVDALSVLGGVLEEFMEVDHTRSGQSLAALRESRQKVQDVLAKFGMSYHSGGRILVANSGAATRSLESVLRARDLPALEMEFERALSTIETDPAAAVTAACATIESLCRVAGHSSTHVTEMFYAHLHPDHLKRAARVIDSVLGNLVTNLVTNSPDHATDAGAPRGAQTPDKIDVAVLNTSRAGVVKLADARDSKSRIRKDVWVRLPPPAPAFARLRRAMARQARASICEACRAEACSSFSTRRRAARSSGTTPTSGTILPR